MLKLMLILKYFCHVSKAGDTQKDIGIDFPDPERSLSEKILSSTIEQANARAAMVVKKQC